MEETDDDGEEDPQPQVPRLSACTWMGRKVVHVCGVEVVLVLWRNQPADA